MRTNPGWREGREEGEGGREGGRGGREGREGGEGEREGRREGEERRKIIIHSVHMYVHYVAQQNRLVRLGLRCMLGVGLPWA